MRSRFCYISTRLVVSSIPCYRRIWSFQRFAELLSRSYTSALVTTAFINKCCAHEFLKRTALTPKTCIAQFDLCFQGDAVFWYNLKRSGKGDYETEHAACPVLCGNKWGELQWAISDPPLSLFQSARAFLFSDNCYKWLIICMLFIYVYVLL